MTYPGAAIIILGVSLAAILYYFSGSGQEEQQQQQSHRNSNRRPAPDRNSSSYSNSYEERRRDSTSSLYNADCPICCNSSETSKKIKLDPCNHVFHENCIKTWMNYGSESMHNRCPNCRTRIRNRL